MSGWIKLHRNIKSHWIYNEKPFSKYHAWMDILLSANHKDNRFLLGNELLEVKRGSFITSELKLMDRWGWSKTKVRNFLKLLENDGMIVKTADREKTTLTVVNYEVWQRDETTEKPRKDQEETIEEPQGDHRETTEELRKDTNKNVKNEKNKEYIDVFNFYLSLNLIKHRAYTNDMAKAIIKAVKDNKYDIEYCKILLKRHERVVEISKNTEYPVKERGFAEFFGQKVFNATHLICSEYEEGGKYYEQYIKNDEPKNTTRSPLKMVYRDNY